MKRIINYIKNKDTIFLFILLIAIFFSISQVFPEIIASDYLWNFQSTYKMYNGYKIYQDINVIVTPFFFYIGLFLFKILGANMLTFNLYGIIINALILTYTYIILKNLKCGKLLSFITLLGISIISINPLSQNGANYNFLALLLSLIAINLEIKDNIKKNKYTNYLQGIVLFLICFTKQNIGIIFLLSITIYKFIKNNNKKDFIKECIPIYLEIFILGIAFLIYLKTTQTWDGFFYYCLSGMGDFLNNFGLEKIGNNDIFFLIIIPIVVAILGIFGIKKKEFNNVESKNVKLLICTSIGSIAYIVPLCNALHLLLMSFINIISIIYIVKSIFKIEINHKSKIIKTIIIILIITNIMQVGSFVYKCIKIESIKISDRQNTFYNATIPKEIYDSMNEITKYIKEKQEQNINVIVIYKLSGIYMIPLNKNNGKFDCINSGNLGKDGANGVIKEIENMKNTEILILKDDDKVFWQEPEEIRKYIKDNLEENGEIGEFSIYKTVEEI